MLKVQKFKSSNLESKIKVQIPNFHFADQKFKIPDLKRKHYNSKVNIFSLNTNLCFKRRKINQKFQNLNEKIQIKIQRFKNSKINKFKD